MQHLFRVNDELLKIADNITYVGCNMNKGCDHSLEIRGRTDQATGFCNHLKKVLCIITDELIIHEICA